MKTIDAGLAKWTGGMVSSNSMQYRENIATEVKDFRDIKQQLASFNGARIDDANAPGMETIGVELAKPTGGGEWFYQPIHQFRGNITMEVGVLGDIE
jgi:hypothetical protein